MRKTMAFWALVTVILLQANLKAAVSEPVGLWEFSLPDPNITTVGNDLELVGAMPTVDGIDEFDGAVRMGVGSHFRCTHGIAPNGGGTQVNEWTILIDFAYPPESVGVFKDLFQTDPDNLGDSDWTVAGDGAVGISAVGYTRAVGYYTDPNDWYRMVMVVDNGTLHDLYMDGHKTIEGNEQGIDGRFSLADVLLLFAANDGDDNDIDISTVAIWDVPLAAGEVAALGGAGDSVYSANIGPEVDAGANQEAELDGAGSVIVSLDGTATDAEDDPMTYLWEKVSGPADVVFGLATEIDTTATFTLPGQYVLQLTADDGVSAFDTVLIVVRPYNYGGLIVSWDFEETWNGTSVEDVSGNLNDGTIVDGSFGTASYMAAKDGQGLRLDNGDFSADGDYVSLDMAMPDSGTVVMWYKPVAFYNYHSIFDNSGNGDDWEMWIYSDSRLRFRVQSNSYVTANLNSLADDGDGTNDWWHIAVTWARNESAVDVQMYVNGELIQEDSGSWVDPGASFYLGGGNTGNDFCNGTYDNVMIYNRVLSGPDVLDLIFAGNKPPFVDAGKNQTHWLEESGDVTFTLEGIVDDIDGSPTGDFSILWSKVSGPNEIVIQTPTLEDTSVTISTAGTYELQLWADDGQFEDSDTVIIEVWPFGYVGLIAHWSFDDGDPNGTDVSGNDNHGTFVDGAVGTTAFVPGKPGKALDLQNGDYAADGDYISLNLVMPDSGSIAMWYKVFNMYNYQSIFDNSVQQDDWEMWIYGDGRLRGRIEGNTAVTANLHTLAADGDARDEWFHIVFTWTKTGEATVDTQLYVDGILRDEASGTWVAPGDYFYLGGGNVGNDFGDGVWDEVRIYERVLTPLEIQLMASMSDYDDDKDVDMDDLADLLNEWMTDNPGCEAASVFDNNVDCKVDLGDFANFARFWLLGVQ